MARHNPGECPSRVLSRPVPPPLHPLQALASSDVPAGLHDVALGLWQAARDTAGQVDREVTVRLLLGACHLLGGAAVDGPGEVALAAAHHALRVLRERRPVDVDELLRVAWALAELESLPQEAGSTLQRRGPGRGVRR